MEHDKNDKNNLNKLVNGNNSEFTKKTVTVVAATTTNKTSQNINSLETSSVRYEKNGSSRSERDKHGKISNNSLL